MIGCYRCGKRPVWQVSTIDQGGGRDSCLDCLGIVTADFARVWRIFELKLTAIDEMGTLA